MTMLRANPDRPDRIAVNPLYAAEEGVSVPRFRLPGDGMAPDVAAQIVRDEAMLDGNARQNLATFVTTWMEPQARDLYAEAFDKNLVDKDEYPYTAAVEDRCVRILADLWHCPDPAGTVGTSTVGSSEACMLAGLAFKRRWQQARRAAGAATDRPNIVMSSAVQVVWEKFATYWDVEPRLVPLGPGETTLSVDGMLAAVDEHTIGVVAVLGVTYTGDYEPVAALAAALDDLEQRTGLDVPLHVDGASGAMIAPFLDPELVWDFQLTRVHSINTSGHKYGLVYPGLGWVVWRSADLLPEELIFHVAYLGGDMPTFDLNFSRPGAQVLLQYYNFLRLGFAGYRMVQQASRDVACQLSAAIGAREEFTLLTDGSQLPVFAWTLSPEVTGWDLHDLAAKLQERGWQVPAYPLAANREDETVMRIVVRNGLSPDLADAFLETLDHAVATLHRPGRGRHAAFRH